MVGGLSHAGRFHLEAHAAHRRENGIDRHIADDRGVNLALAAQVATTNRHGEVDGQAALVVESGDVQVAVEHAHTGRALDVAGGNHARTASVETQGDLFVEVAGEHDIFQVQDDVGDVLDNTGDGVELVEGVVEPHHGDGGTGHRRQQRAAQRVAEGVAETRLKWGDSETLTVRIG